MDTTAEAPAEPLQFRCRVQYDPHGRNAGHTCDSPRPHIPKGTWRAQMLASGTPAALADEMLALSNLRGTQMRHGVPLAGDPTDTLLTVAADLTVVITSAPARSDGETRRSHMAQVLDTRTSPAKLHNPQIVHDGTHRGALAAAIEWVDRLLHPTADAPTT